MNKVNQSLHASNYRLELLCFLIPRKKKRWEDSRVFLLIYRVYWILSHYEVCTSFIRMNIFVCYSTEHRLCETCGFLSFLEKKREIQCMLAHFQYVDGLTETTLTWNFKDIKPAMLPLELRSPNSYIPTPGPNSPVPQNLGSARNRVITEVIKDEVVALPWWSSY